jgi:Raf kinase inhibitor-like YbhB/YbcL family protein
VSPPLEWTDLPPAAKELALICEDPDAPMKTWVHWVIYGIPATVDHLDEGVSRKPVLPEVGQAKQGKNDGGNVGYDGPRPPRGPVHRYFFVIYALKEPLKLEAGATAVQLRKAMQGKTLEEAEIIGTYSR